MHHAPLESCTLQPAVMVKPIVKRIGTYTVYVPKHAAGGVQAARLWSLRAPGPDVGDAPDRSHPLPPPATCTAACSVQRAACAYGTCPDAVASGHRSPPLVLESWSLVRAGPRRGRGRGKRTISRNPDAAPCQNWHGEYCSTFLRIFGLFGASRRIACPAPLLCADFFRLGLHRLQPASRAHGHASDARSVLHCPSLKSLKLLAFLASSTSMIAYIPWARVRSRVAQLAHPHTGDADA